MSLLKKIIAKRKQEWHDLSDVERVLKGLMAFVMLVCTIVMLIVDYKGGDTTKTLYISLSIVGLLRVIRWLTGNER